MHPPSPFNEEVFFSGVHVRPNFDNVVPLQNPFSRLSPVRSPSLRTARRPKRLKIQHITFGALECVRPEKKRKRKYIHFQLNRTIQPFFLIVRFSFVFIFIFIFHDMIFEHFLVLDDIFSRPVPDVFSVLLYELIRSRILLGELFLF